MQKLNQVIRLLDKIGIFSRWTNIIGISALFLMIVLNFLDVILDLVLFHHPIKGVTEVTEIMMLCGISLAIAHCQNEKSHIAVDVVTSHLSWKNRLIVDFITNIMGFGIIGLAIWRIIEQAIYFAEKNMMHAQYLPIPSAPFAFVIAIGFTTMWLLMLRDILKLIVESVQTGLSKYQWMMVVVLVILVLVIGLFMQRGLWQINMKFLPVLGICFFTVLLLAGMPIYLTMILTAVVFISHIRGTMTGYDMIATDTYRSLGSYGYAVLPFS